MEWLSEGVYYDGVRRIQEVYTYPLLALGESAALGDPEAQGEVSQGGEEEGQTLEGEEGQIEQGSGEPGGEDPPGLPPNTFITYLEREYLWGPGDGITSGAGAGLDELIGIFDIDRRAWWTLLDASGDVVAIVDDSDSTLHGYGTGVGGVSSPARMCGQFGYDAYGQLIAVQSLHPFPDPRTGHKGLHLDRLDAGVADPLTGASIARHEVGATHAYFVRNRHYSPELGRFLQRDPNATGVVALWTEGGFGWSVPSPMLVDAKGHMADGVGVYGVVRSSPFNRSDPSGLFSLGEQVVRAGLQVAAMSMAMPTDYLRTIARELVSEYSANMSWDAMWADDFELADDMHTRGDDRWVGLAMARGAYMAVTEALGDDEFVEGLESSEFAMGVRGAGGGGRTTKSTMRAAGRAQYRDSMTVNGYTAHRYTDVGGGRSFIVFEKTARRARVRVVPSSREKEVAEANRLAGFATTPKGWVWHHEYRKGIMSLVPEDLHAAFGHIGRARYW